jgi:hypothetical protein
MSLRLTKPVGYSFASNYVKGKIAKDDAARASTSKGPSQDKARATPFQAKAKVVCATPNPSTLVSPLKLVLWGSSYLTEYHGLPTAIKQDIQFAAVLNKSEGGGKLTERVVTEVLGYLTTNPDPNQIFLFLFGGNNLRDAKRGEREIGMMVSRFQTILEGIKKINARVVVCGLIPDPLYENLDYRFMDMDHSLSTLDFAPLGTFLELRTPVLNSQGFIRGDCYKPYKIHLSKTGAKIVGLKINKHLKNLIRPVQVQVQAQILPAAVSIPHPREAELASLWLLVRGYPIPTPSQPPQPLLSPPIPSPQLNEELANEMETDAPVEVESINTPAPDYPETDENDQAATPNIEMETNEPNMSAAAIVSNNQNERSNNIPDPNIVPEAIVQPSGSNVNSVQINLVQPALKPQRPEFFSGPSSSDTVQAAPVNQIEFVPTRASAPTPNLDMLDQTSGSVTSQATLDARKLLADHDQSMVVGVNETIVEKMQKTALKPKLDDIMEEPESSGKLSKR